MNTNFDISYFEVSNHVNVPANSGFLNSSIIDIWSRIIVVVGDCLAYGKMFNSIPDLYSVDALLSMTTKNICRQGYSQMTSCGQTPFWLKITCALNLHMPFQTVSMYYQKWKLAGLLCSMSHFFKLSNLMLKCLCCFLV